MTLLKTVFSRFAQDDCSTMAAALAYYMLFALPPLLYLLLAIVSHGMGLAYNAEHANQKAQDFIAAQAGELIGNDAAGEEIAKMMERNQTQGGVWWKSLISVVGILFGATGVVAAVQNSLNRVWRVEPDTTSGGAKSFVFKRLLSFAMIVGLGFLLLVSMFVSALLATAGSQIGGWLGMEKSFVAWGNYAVIFFATVVVFASLLKFMPDAKISWQDVWIGALATAVLFSAGRMVMEQYFAASTPGAKLGSAAASLAVLLVWVYYTAMIVLLGAEFTCVWSQRHGEKILPVEGAVKIETRIVKT